MRPESRLNPFIMNAYIFKLSAILIIVKLNKTVMAQKSENKKTGYIQPVFYIETKRSCMSL